MAVDVARWDAGGRALLVAVDGETVARLRASLAEKVALEEVEGEDRLAEVLLQGAERFDAVVLGAALGGPVRAAQRVHVAERDIPVLILTEAGRRQELVRTVLFSPFLGPDVLPWATEKLGGLAPAIEEAVARRRRRRSYRLTLASAQNRLGSITLIPPEVTHYLDRLLDYAPIGVVTVDPRGTMQSLNRRAERILGASEKELLQTSLEALFPSRQRSALAALLARAGVGGTHGAPEIFQLDGAGSGRRFVEVTATGLADHIWQKGSLLILQDVTDRVEAERQRELAEAEARFQTNVLRDFHRITSDPSLDFGAKVERLLGLGCERFELPSGVLVRVEAGQCEILHSAGTDQSVARGARFSLDSSFCGIALTVAEPLAIEHAATSRWRAHPCCAEGGRQAYLGVRVQVNGEIWGTLSFSGSEPCAAAFTFTDLEIIKLMAQWVGNELQRQRDEAHIRQLAGALEQAADAAIITDRERRIEYVNRSFEQLTGYARNEIIGQKTYFLRSGVHGEQFYDELWKTISSGEIYRGILVNRKKDGAIYHEEKTITPLRDANGNITHFISTGHDITERMKAEEAARLHQTELAHVARLSTLGEMTSGLAHELNQPLCAITTYAQTCLRIIREQGCSPEKVRYGLEEVVRQAELAGAIFRRLRNFARKGEVVKRRINMRDVVREVAEFMRAELTQKEITLRIEGAGPIPYVLTDPIQIEQVIVNLVRNSMDAMAAPDPREKRLTIRARKAGRGSVKVSISDTGPGCPAEHAERLFEPFFTTKPNGLGIGLGISQTIIEDHGGRLWLEANTGEGATFSFVLPSYRDSEHAADDPA